MAKQDSAWKDVLRGLFPQFLEFFFPEIYRDIDFTAGFQFLDKELAQILKNSKVGKQIVDILVRVKLNDGQEKWLLIHVEVQGYPEKQFAQRLYIYNYRIFEHYKQESVTLVVLSDPRPGFRPSMYQFRKWGFEKKIQFPVVKLLDYREQWDFLTTQTNPFARVVMAFLKTLETMGQPSERYSWKKKFILELYQTGLHRDTILTLYKFIDWIMTLPRDLEERIFMEVQSIEKGKQMAYLSYAERKGLKEGKRLGKRLGRIEELQRVIQIFLETRFGEEGRVQFESLKSLKSLKALQAIYRDLITAENIEQVRTIVQKYLPEE